MCAWPGLFLQPTACNGFGAPPFLVLAPVFNPPTMLLAIELPEATAKLGEVA